MTKIVMITIGMIFGFTGVSIEADSSFKTKNKEPEAMAKAKVQQITMQPMYTFLDIGFVGCLK